MNEVQHNREVVFPDNYSRLADYVRGITDEYIEMEVPDEVLWDFDWKHETFTKLFDRVDKIDNYDDALFGDGTQLVMRRWQTIRLYYRKEVARQLFPHKHMKG